MNEFSGTMVNSPPSSWRPFLALAAKDADTGQNGSAYSRRSGGPACGTGFSVRPTEHQITPHPGDGQVHQKIRSRLVRRPPGIRTLHPKMVHTGWRCNCHTCRTRLSWSSFGWSTARNAINHPWSGDGEAYFKLEHTEFHCRAALLQIMSIMIHTARAKIILLAPNIKSSEYHEMTKNHEVRKSSKPDGSSGLKRVHLKP